MYFIYCILYIFICLISQKLSSIFSFFNFLRNSVRFFQISSESSRFSPKITEWEIYYSKKSGGTSDFWKILKKSLPFSPEIKNSRKIAETLDLKNSVKNLIFSLRTILLSTFFPRSFPGGNISQNFSEIIFDFFIFQFLEKFWEIFQIPSESSRLSPKITEWEI